MAAGGCLAVMCRRNLFRFARQEQSYRKYSDQSTQGHKSKKNVPRNCCCFKLIRDTTIEICFENGLFAVGKIVLRVRKLSCAVAAVDNFEERTPCVRGDMAGG